MNHDQADELRQLVRTQVRQISRSETNPHLIAVTGGQRGVGTTTLALNLAVSLCWPGNGRFWSMPIWIVVPLPDYAVSPSPARSFTC